MTNESEAIVLEQRHFDALDCANELKLRVDLRKAYAEIPDLFRTIPALQEQCRQQGLMLASISGALGASRNEDCEAAAFALQARVAGLDAERTRVATIINPTMIEQPGDGDLEIWARGCESERLAFAERCGVPKEIERLIATPPKAPAVPGIRQHVVELLEFIFHRFGQPIDAAELTDKAVSAVRGLEIWLGMNEFAKPAAPDNFEPVLSDNDLVNIQNEVGLNTYINLFGLLKLGRAIERAALLKAKAPAVGLSDDQIHSAAFQISCPTEDGDYLFDADELIKFARHIESAVAGRGEHE